MKDKIILIRNGETVIATGNNTGASLVIEINSGNLDFELYCHTSAEQVALKKGFAVNGNRVRIVEFEDEIYLRAKSDKEAIAPICIEERESTLLTIVDLRETDCTSIVEDMKGNVNQVAQNFDIVEGRPFLTEDEFSL